MKIFVAGATGATGKLLVRQLLQRGQQVVAVVRSTARVPEDLRANDNLQLIQASLLDLSDADLAQYVAGCNAVASCLGHNMTFKGMYGKPRRLVTDAARRLCQAIKANRPDSPVKYILMNTAGNSNRDLDEPVSNHQKMVVGIMKAVLPPQADNEKAADFLRTEIGQDDPLIKWAAVRPDSLIDEEAVTEYTVYPSPIRSPIFDPGQTSRINVAHFMAELITNEATWAAWQGQMPVIYNNASS
ncbi:SDR family oxidoreductase [bacterium]|nr:SDR family oxidoreductase [bacterium]